MAELNANLGPGVLIVGALLAVGLTGLVLLAFALFMRWSKREEAENRRQMLK